MNFGKLTSRVISSSLIAGLVPLLTGCLTSRLWDDDVLVNHREPAANPNVKLFERSNRSDFLVQYDEVKESGGALRLRSYYLVENESRLEVLKKPHFILVRPGLKLQPVPVLYLDETNTTVSVPATRAEMSMDGKGFTVYQDGQKLGAYKLPVYPNLGSQVTKVALTPLTAAVDLTYAPVALVFILAVYFGFSEGL